MNPEDYLRVPTGKEVSDEYILPPLGDWPMLCTSVEAKEYEGQIIFEYHFNVDAPEVQAVTGREDNDVKYAVWVDLTDDGLIDDSPGKNVKYGQLLTAIGKNVAGTLPTDPVGHRVLGHIEHSGAFANVTRVAKPA